MGVMYVACGFMTVVGPPTNVVGPPTIVVVAMRLFLALRLQQQTIVTMMEIQNITAATMATMYPALVTQQY